jgi:hypothetical protein
MHNTCLSELVVFAVLPFLARPWRENLDHKKFGEGPVLEKRRDRIRGLAWAVE